MSLRIPSHSEILCFHVFILHQPCEISFALFYNLRKQFLGIQLTVIAQLENSKAPSEGQQLLSTYCVLGTELGLRMIKMNEI